MNKKHEFITIVLFGLLIVGASFFYSDNLITGLVTNEKHENLIGPPINCEGKGLPPQKYINAFESKAWYPEEIESDKTRREFIIKYS